jgi:hypothetical protein
MWVNYLYKLKKREDAYSAPQQKILVNFTVHEGGFKETLWLNQIVIGIIYPN